MSELNINLKNIFRYILVFLNNETLRIKNLDHTIFSQSFARTNEMSLELNNFENYYQITEQKNEEFLIIESEKIKNQIHLQELENMVSEINASNSELMIEILQKYHKSNKNRKTMSERISFFVKFIDLRIDFPSFQKLSDLMNGYGKNCINEYEMASIINSEIYMFVDNSLYLTCIIFNILLSEYFDFALFVKYLFDFADMTTDDSNFETENNNEMIHKRYVSNAYDAKNFFLIKNMLFHRFHNQYLTQFLDYFFMNFNLNVYNDNQDIIFTYKAYLNVINSFLLSITSFERLILRFQPVYSCMILSSCFFTNLQYIKYEHLNNIGFDLTNIIVSEFQSDIEKTSISHELIQYFFGINLEKKNVYFIISEFCFVYDGASGFECINQQQKNINKFILADYCFHIILHSLVKNEFPNISFHLASLFRSYLQTLMAIENPDFSLNNFKFLKNPKKELHMTILDYESSNFMHKYLGKKNFMILTNTSFLQLKNWHASNKKNHPEYLYGHFEIIRIFQCFYLDIFCNLNSNIIRFSQNASIYHEMKIIIPKLDLNLINKCINIKHILEYVNIEKSIFRIFFRKFIIVKSRMISAKFNYQISAKVETLFIKNSEIQFFDRIPNTINKIVISCCILYTYTEAICRLSYHQQLFLKSVLFLKIYKTVFSHNPQFICRFQNIKIDACTCNLRMIVFEKVSISITKHIGILYFDNLLLIKFMSIESYFYYTNEIADIIAFGKKNFDFYKIQFDDHLFLDILNFSYSFSECRIMRGVQIMVYNGDLYTPHFKITIPNLNAHADYIDVNFNIIDGKISFFNYNTSTETIQNYIS